MVHLAEVVILPRLRQPWDYLLGPSAASLNSSSLNMQVGLIILPAPGGVFLNYQLSLQPSPTCSWSSPSRFLGITG